jgi:hypothetical protein
MTYNVSPIRSLKEIGRAAGAATAATGVGDTAAAADGTEKEVGVDEKRQSAGMENIAFLPGECWIAVLKEQNGFIKKNSLAYVIITMA